MVSPIALKFSDPWWLAAGLLAGIVMLWMWRRHDARQQAALALFVAPHLRLQLTRSISPLGRLVQRSLLLASTLCLFTALAGPLLGFHWERISRRGNEVVFAIDTSRSMLTPDVKPDRLTRAKLAIDDMARQLEGDAVGIVAFSGTAFLVCPLTLDYSAFEESLGAIDTHTIPHGGTNIASAIREARAALRRRPGSDKIMILVTDGEDLDGTAAAAATEAAAQEGMKIFTVGVGTAAGDLIPIPQDQGGGFVKDEAGGLVKSHLDENALQAIASATGGTYVRLGSRAEDYERFLATAFGTVAKHDLLYKQQKIYNERYQWPLAASLSMLLMSLVVGRRRSVRRPAEGATMATMSPVALVLLLATPILSRSAEQTVVPSKPADAAAPVLDYNVGASAYRSGNFPAATQAFKESIKAAPASDARRLSDQEDAYYNLGNALYRSGQLLEKSVPQEAIQRWTDAVKAYDTALQLRADDADSKFNRDLVERKIEALRQPPQGGGGGGGPGQGGDNGQGQGNGEGKGNGQGGSQGKPKNQGQGNNQGQGGQGQGKDEGQGSNRAPPTQGQGGNQQLPSNQGPAPMASPSVESPRAPGEMSAEEARELLDSAKSDEHHTLGVPSGPRDPDNTPEKPFKNW